MSERTYHTIDKSDWGPGAWQEEPDKIQWADETTGYPCLVVRQASSGHWCGYVGVTEGHPAFEKDYDDVHDLFPSWSKDGHLSVHGGLTYSAHCAEGDETTSVCHVPEPGEPDHVWWLGFDCMHLGDFSPGYYARNKFPWHDDDEYRTLGYVRDEVTRLAGRLAELGGV